MEVGIGVMYHARLAASSDVEEGFPRNVGTLDHIQMDQIPTVISKETDSCIGDEVTFPYA